MGSLHMLSGPFRMQEGTDGSPCFPAIFLGERRGDRPTTRRRAQLSTPEQKARSVNLGETAESRECAGNEPLQRRNAHKQRDRRAVLSDGGRWPW